MFWISLSTAAQYQAREAFSETSDRPVRRAAVTDKLRSYVRPIKTLAPNADHRARKGLNNRTEGSHRSTRKREKLTGRFKSPWQAQRFLAAHDQIKTISVPAATVSPPHRTATPAPMHSIFGEATFLKWSPEGRGSRCFWSGVSKLAMPPLVQIP